jgi:hypothetical protein
MRRNNSYPIRDSNSATLTVQPVACPIPRKYGCNKRQPKQRREVTQIAESRYSNSSSFIRPFIHSIIHLRGVVTLGEVWGCWEVVASELPLPEIPERRKKLASDPWIRLERQSLPVSWDGPETGTIPLDLGATLCSHNQPWVSGCRQWPARVAHTSPDTAFDTKNSRSYISFRCFNVLQKHM